MRDEFDDIIVRQHQMAVQRLSVTGYIIPASIRASVVRAEHVITNDMDHMVLTMTAFVAGERTSHDVTHTFESPTGWVDHLLTNRSRWLIPVILLLWAAIALVNVWFLAGHLVATAVVLAFLLWRTTPHMTTTTKTTTVHGHALFPDMVVPPGQDRIHYYFTEDSR